MNKAILVALSCFAVLGPSCEGGTEVGNPLNIGFTAYQLSSTARAAGKVEVDTAWLAFRELKLRKDPACPICSEHQTQTELIDYQQFCGIEPEVAHDDEFDIDSQALDAWVREGRDIVILDVRTPQEFEIARLPNSILIPLQELPDRLGELDPAATIVAHCHHGMRSARAVNLLREVGFARTKNLAGGIDAWSLTVDPSVPRY